MIQTYIFKHTDGKTSIYTYDDIINNAREQAAAGVTPSYHYNYGTSEKPDYSAAGYLVLSGKNGAVVCILLDDNKAFIIKGWQGEFTVF